MIVQDLDLYDYGGWQARIYYAEHECFGDEVLDDLMSVGYEGGDFERVAELLYRCRRNTGFTYTNNRERRSVVFIAPTDSASEFNDSYTHESGHLAKHIAKELGIDPWGEAYQYLAGEIAYQTFPAAKRFLCDHCRSRLTNEGGYPEEKAMIPGRL